MSDSGTAFEPIDTEMLTPIVRQALGNETMEVTCWDIQQVHGGFGFGGAGGSAIHRVSGQGKDGEESFGWALVLKALYPPVRPSHPSDWDYWRREAHAYESGLLDDLPGGLAAPRCFGVVDQPNGECWIWMEDVTDDIGDEWPLEQYGLVARHLGRFNGVYLTGQRPIPSYPWLRGTDYFRNELEEADLVIARLREAQVHRLVRRMSPPDVVDLLERRWADQKEYMNVIDRFPPTLCHGDAFRRNLFARRVGVDDYETVGIDWAVLGIGWIGRDIKMLVGNSMSLLDVEPAEARERDQVAFSGYLDGLCSVGWDGDPREARLGQIVTLGGPRSTLMDLELCLDESQHARLEQSLGGTVWEMADRAAERTRHPPQDRWLGWGEEARELLAEL